MVTLHKYVLLVVTTKYSHPNVVKAFQVYAYLVLAKSSDRQ